MRFLKGLKEHFVPTEGNAYRPRILHRSWLVFFLAVILATEGFLVADLVARQTSENFLAAVVPAEIIALTNTERTQNDVGQLTENAELDAAAQAKASDMAANDYFSHVGPDGKTPWQWISQYGYQYQYAGENLAVRFVDSQDVINAWMASPTHRANIVQPVYTEIGVGVADGLYEGQEATYVVQYFGTPLVAASEVALAELPPTQAPAPVERAPVATAVAPTATSAPQVEGASIAATISAATTPVSTPLGSSDSNSLVRQLMRTLSDPEQAANWILGFCAALLILVLISTFFVHVQLQHSGMLMQGFVVAAFALSFLALNTQLGSTFAGSGQNQAAGVIESAALGGVVIDPQAASTGYALFP